MKRYSALCAVLLFIFVTIVFATRKQPEVSGAPPYGEAESEVPSMDPYAWIKHWKRPEGPAKVGLQVGHWKNDELPAELSRLIGNTGASGRGVSETQVNKTIATEVAKLLQERGVVVEILPATVPPAFLADAFIAIHADGSTDRSVSGYKIAAPWRDLTRRAHLLVAHIETAYEKETKLTKDPNITRNMRGYYAFSFWRYEHAVHPMTTSAIVETGFLTNAQDQKLLIDAPHIAAGGIANGILAYLEEQGVLSSQGSG